MSIDAVTGRSKGFCFIEFDEPAYAEAAMVMDGFELAGRKIKVGWPAKAPGAAPAVAANPLAMASALAAPSLAAPAVSYQYIRLNLISFLRTLSIFGFQLYLNSTLSLFLLSYTYTSPVSK